MILFLTENLTSFQQEYDTSSMLGLYPFQNETIINIHRMPDNQADTISYNVVNNGTENGDENVALIGTVYPGERSTIPQPKVLTRNYLQSYQRDNKSNSKNKTKNEEPDDDYFDGDDKNVVEHVFPTLEYEQCLIVTDRSVYTIQLKTEPHILFLNLVRSGNWKACEEFCKVFNLDYMQCVEYAGDVLLRKNEVTQSLLTYNVAKVCKKENFFSITIANYYYYY